MELLGEEAHFFTTHTVSDDHCCYTASPLGQCFSPDLVHVDQCPSDSEVSVSQKKNWYSLAHSHPVVVEVTAPASVASHTLSAVAVFVESLVALLLDFP